MFSVKYYLIVYDSRCLIADIIHLLHPQHCIFRFKFFGYIFFFGEFFYQSEKKLLGLFLCIGKVRVEFAGSKQIVIQNFVVVF